MISFGSALLALTLLAADDRIDACASAAERAERLKRSAQFVEALSELANCVPDDCPRVVRDHCRQMKGAVENDVPTIVVVVQSKERDLDRATVTIDGHPREWTHGVPMALNPGLHRIRSQAEGFETVDTQIVVRSGEKSRAVLIALVPRAPAPPVPSAFWSVGRWVASGLTVASAATFAVMGVSAQIELTTLRTSCAPACSPTAVQSVRDHAGVADVFLISTVAWAIVSAVAWALSWVPPEPSHE